MTGTLWAGLSGHKSPAGHRTSSPPSMTGGLYHRGAGVYRSRTEDGEHAVVERYWSALGSKVLSTGECEVRRRCRDGGMQLRRKRKHPEETSRPTAMSATFPKCKDPGDPAGNRTQFAMMGGE
ncbi:hypothetical protein PR048_015441 [Dryococelus australis]|uniref:Uncharacterized protein n=1 Tax=Dryococelus australis TaxID=614101 RepID=A0ABQ9HH83_9NEOP|nr:hypothetical protein PR048_015441 [Dryococelus australis]